MNSYRNNAIRSFPHPFRHFACLDAAVAVLGMRSGRRAPPCSAKVLRADGHPIGRKDNSA
jgi:hypothetical protein